MTVKNDKYPVGYKKPPMEYSFRPGQSGNPKGRPRKFPDLLRQLENVYREEIPFQKGRKKVLVPRLVVVAHKQMESALKGNPKAIAAVMQHASMLGAVCNHPFMDGGGIDVKSLTDEELQEFMRLIKKVAPEGSLGDEDGAELQPE
jgi:hypothetical protein